MKSIATEIEELRAMDVPALVVKYEELFGKKPRARHRTHLWRRCAWKLQEQRLGGLSNVAKTRLEELIGQIDLPLGEAAPPPSVRGSIGRGGDPPIGTTLSREWHGTEVSVRRTESGWEVDGVTHRSLSAAAKAVTGSHWNGRLFWGLSKRGAKK